VQRQSSAACARGTQWDRVVGTSDLSLLEIWGSPDRPGARFKEEVDEQESITGAANALSHRTGRGARCSLWGRMCRTQGRSGAEAVGFILLLRSALIGETPPLVRETGLVSAGRGRAGKREIEVAVITWSGERADDGC